MTTGGNLLGDARLRLRADASGLESDLEKAEQSTNQRMQRMAASTRQLGLAFTAVGAVAVAGLASAVSAASDLEESVNAVNVVFGEGAETILNYGETAADAVGLAQSDFNQLATTSGALFQNFGIGAQEAADNTVLLTQRAADLASVHNTDVKDALAALTSALRGETEPLRRYAADVSDATLQAYLHSEGIDTQVSSLSQAEKGLLRFEVAMAQTEVVQGDFQNTADSLANSSRILFANIKDLRAELGQHLLPILAPIVQTILEAVQGVVGWAEANPTAARTIMLVVAALGGLALAVGGVLLAVSLLTGAVTALGVATAVATGGITVALAAIVAGIVILIANWDDLKFKIQDVINFIINLLNKATAVHRHAFASMIDTTANFVAIVNKDAAEAMRGFADEVREGIPEMDAFGEEIHEVNEGLVEQIEQEDAATAALEEAIAKTREATEANEEGGEAASDLADETENLTDEERAQREEKRGRCWPPAGRPGRRRWMKP